MVQEYTRRQYTYRSSGKSFSFPWHTFIQQQGLSASCVLTVVLRARNSLNKPIFASAHPKFQAKKGSGYLPNTTMQMII